MSVEPGAYGIVKIENGPNKDCIVYYDNDEWDDDDNHMAVVYFGGFLIVQKIYLISHEDLSYVSINDLMKRKDELYLKCSPFNINRKEIDLDSLNFNLAELHLVETTLLGKIMDNRYENRPEGIKVFISHSSVDKPFARSLCMDLEDNGFIPWLDEWNIMVGESIPEKISIGIKEAEFIIVILSNHSVNSRWVETEWQTKYWTEIAKGRIHVLPILLEDCEVPELLKTKRYADFRKDFNKGLLELTTSLKSLAEK